MGLPKPCEVAVIARNPFRIPIVFVASCLCSLFWTSNILAANSITEVSVSSDLRRVAIKTEARTGVPTASEMSRPSRLVIDVPGATVTTGAANHRT